MLTKTYKTCERDAVSVRKVTNVSEHHTASIFRVNEEVRA
jgi:hypothetical protein